MIGGGEESPEIPADETPEADESAEVEEGEGETAEEGAEETPDGEEEATEGEEEAEEDAEEGEEAEEEQEEEPEEEVDPDFGPAKDKHGRENRIPHSRVVKMVQKKVAKEVGRVTGIIGRALGIKDGEVTTQTLTTALNEVQELRGYVGGFMELEETMRSNGDEMIRRLAKANPEQYGKFAAVLEPGYKPKSGGVDADANMPLPDVDITLPDGSKGRTYSAEQLTKRDEWFAEKIAARTLALAEDKLGKRIKPFEDANAAAAREREDNQRLANSIKEMLTEAREDWEGFKEHEKEIQAEYNKIDKRVPMGRALRQAWQKVVMAKLKGSKKAVRQQVTKELKEAPVATSARGRVGKKVTADVVRNEDGEVVEGSEAAIRRSIAKAKAAGIK